VREEEKGRESEGEIGKGRMGRVREGRGEGPEYRYIQSRT
jgi:hypothetical protein